MAFWLVAGARFELATSEVMSLAGWPLPYPAPKGKGTGNFLGAADPPIATVSERKSHKASHTTDQRGC